MKYLVKVKDQTFEVEVGNLSDRPVLATVQGETFEVWPEAVMQAETPPLPAALPAKEAPPPAAPTPIASLSADKLRLVRSPIPGVITAIQVHVGSQVAVGQELCKLEAMKMNNSIRANHAGKISAVNISIGQHVKHNDILLEFEV